MAAAVVASAADDIHFVTKRVNLRIVYHHGKFCR